MRWGRAWTPSSQVSLVAVGDTVAGGPARPQSDQSPSGESAVPAEARPLDSPEGAAGAWSYVVAAGVPLAFAVFMLVQSLDLGLGSMVAPGPGLWPFAVSVALVALAATLLAGWDRFGSCEPWGSGAVRALIGAVSVAPFILLVPQVGFEIPAVALLAFWMKALGGETWRLSLAIALGTVVVLHGLFIEVLGMSLPYLFGF